MEKLPGDNLYQKIRNAEKFGVKTFPKTSQAMPKDYLDAYEKQLQIFDKVLCITVSSKLSGCYNSTIQAREMLKEKERIFILDSLNLPTLLILKAIELIQEQREVEEIITELKNLIPKIHTYLSQANWVRRMEKINLRPLMGMKDGLIAKDGVVFARDMAEALFKKILKESKKENKKLRVTINHADNLEQAEKLKKMLEEKLEVEIPFITLAPPIIAAGAGPGTLIVGWMPIK